MQAQQQRPELSTVALTWHAGIEFDDWRSCLVLLDD